MSDILTEDEVVTIVARLTPDRLVAFVEAGLVRPQGGADGWAFRSVDLARLELLCDLAEGFDFEGDALGLVIGLVDRLHEDRAALAAMTAAIEAEPHEVRVRVAERLARILTR